MSYTSKVDKPLFDMLDCLFTQYGFEFGSGSAPEKSLAGLGRRLLGRRPRSTQITVWRKALAPTLEAELSVSLNPALAPDTWSLEPMVMINSTYVGHWDNQLRLYRDFYPVVLPYEDSESRQVLRYSPAHIRWQERLDLEVPTLKGRLETIDCLREDFADVYEHYIMPMLGQFRTPLMLAEFQLRSETEFRSTRLSWDEPRYKVSTPYISTALLFDEAGETARAVAFLEQTIEELSRVWVTEDPAWTKPKFGQLNRLLEHLRNKSA